MYPVDVARALKMSSAGGPAFSLADFYKSHGLKGFVSQGVVPELVKSSSMRVSKFFFFPQFCNLFWGKPPGKSTPLEKGLAGAVATVPEILMISPMVSHHHNKTNHQDHFCSELKLTKAFWKIMYDDKNDDNK